MKNEVNTLINTDIGLSNQNNDEQVFTTDVHSPSTCHFSSNSSSDESSIDDSLYSEKEDDKRNNENSFQKHLLQFQSNYTNNLKFMKQFCNNIHQKFNSFSHTNNEENLNLN